MVKDGLGLLGALAEGGVETVGWLEVTITGDVWLNVAQTRLEWEVNFTRRSSFNRAMSVCSEGGCCTCLTLLEQNAT